MSGNIIGGKSAATTNKLKYGDDFYKVIGSTGGKKGTTGGFFANSELARRAGAKGGKISRRKPTTQCPKGHAYTPDNVYSHVSATGVRVQNCRACALEQTQRKRMRKECTNA